MWPNEAPSAPANGRASSGSEVAVISENAPVLPSPVRDLPTIANIHNSSRVHLGPNIYNVSTTVHSNEVIEGRFLGLEVVSPTRARRLRCCVAVFVCWAITIAAGLGIYLLSISLSERARLDLDLNETWYLRRPDWQAMPPSSKYHMDMLPVPVNIAMIGHSALSNCTQLHECIMEVRSIQKEHLERFGDIGPNFLVGGEGFVFEGAGANVAGAVMYGMNFKLVSIMFLGDYTTCTPNQLQFDHVAALLEVLVKHGILDPNYVLYGYCQIKTFTIPPGPNIMRRLHEFPHWDKENATKCLGKSL